VTAIIFVFLVSLYSAIGGLLRARDCFGLLIATDL
jgi:hypothetical protein